MNWYWGSRAEKTENARELINFFVIHMHDVMDYIYGYFSSSCAAYACAEYIMMDNSLKGVGDLILTAL